MNFATPEALAAHLAETIDDKFFIAMAVRIKFPGWTGGDPRSHFEPKRHEPAPRLTTEQSLKSVRKSKTTYAARAYGTTFDQDNGWFSSDLNDRAVRAMIEQGSEKLLAAIKREHGEIVQHLTRVA